MIIKINILCKKGLSFNLPLKEKKYPFLTEKFLLIE